LYAAGSEVETLADTSPVEREIKLRFQSAEVAQHALASLGATLARRRRLQDDRLLDSPGDDLRTRRCALRVRLENGECRLTFKGPVLPGAVKIREELETTVGDGSVLLRVLAALGYRPQFRYQKHREEYLLPGLVAAIDETPIGVFIELEGAEAAIEDAAARLGRTRADYVLDSYYSLFQQWRTASGSAKADMVFDPA
jgi:adenylate cyclase class 2